MRESEVDITLDLSKDNLDGSIFSDTLDSEVEPAADPKCSVLDATDSFNFAVFTFVNNLKALSSFSQIWLLIPV